MPSTYAHYRFGRDVAPLLPPEDGRILLKYPELFLIGLHGPDIFFYSNPLGSSPVSRVGYAMHEEPGLSFFTPALEALNTLPDREAGLAYLYGFACHFALDSICHPYVEARREQTGISHTELESEFERRLMLHDGLDPLRHFPAGHIVPSIRNARVIAAFFPSLSDKEVQKSLRSMKICLRLLMTPCPLWHFLVDTAFLISGSYASMHGLLMSRKENPACRESSRRLAQLYRQALPTAVSLIRSLSGCAHGNGMPDPHFRHTFG